MSKNSSLLRRNNNNSSALAYLRTLRTYTRSERPRSVFSNLLHHHRVLASQAQKVPHTCRLKDTSSLPRRARQASAVAAQLPTNKNRTFCLPNHYPFLLNQTPPNSPCNTPNTTLTPQTFHLLCPHQAYILTSRLSTQPSATSAVNARLWKQGL